MFTGLVQDIGTVKAVEEINGDKRFKIETNLDLKNVSTGASMACEGCCLTVVSIDRKTFAVDVSGETLSKTSLGEWGEGKRVNLEPSLRLGDEMGGHIVSGHVDAVVTLEDITQDGESYRLKVRVPNELAKFIAPKGSVTLDGVSLTVNEVEGSVFGVNIIPHTWTHTTLGIKKLGEGLNLEIDMLARYVARMLDK